MVEQEQEQYTPRTSARGIHQTKYEQQLLNGDLPLEQFKLLEEQKDMSLKRNVVLQSQSWPQEKTNTIKPISHVHDYFKTQSSIDPNLIYQRLLTNKDIEEVKALYKEWFPVKYSEDYYNRLGHSNHVCIGCFYKVDQPKYDEVILGVIVARIERGYMTELEDIYEMNRGNLSYWTRFRNMVSCREREHLSAYISTIGVIDEVRRMGIGTLLLQNCVRLIKRDWRRCEIIYLHVISYNKSAIGFYLKNGFEQLKTLTNYYNLFDKHYDAELLYVNLRGQAIQKGQGDPDYYDENNSEGEYGSEEDEENRA